MKRGEVYLVNEKSRMEYRKIIDLANVPAQFESLTATYEGKLVYGYGNSRLIEKFIKKVPKKVWYKLIRRYNESRGNLYL